MTILDQIVETKRRSLAVAKATRPLAQIRSMADKADPPREFYQAVAGGDRQAVQLIAEIKKASPSAGLIVPNFDPVEIAGIYHAHGASALSVLTEETYFQGRPEHIEHVKQAVPLPVLRKDFLVDAYQIYESRAHGADAVLLIAEVLKPDELVELRSLACSMGMAVLVEVHSRENLEVVLHRLGQPSPDSYLLGINNRDLTAQRTDLGTMEKLASTLPPDTPFVAESGLKNHEDVKRAQKAGACAVLVGESLLRAADVGKAVDALMGPR